MVSNQEERIRDLEQRVSTLWWLTIAQTVMWSSRDGLSLALWTGRYRDTRGRVAVTSFGSSLLSTLGQAKRTIRCQDGRCQFVAAQRFNFSQGQLTTVAGHSVAGFLFQTDRQSVAHSSLPSTRRDAAATGRQTAISGRTSW